MVTALIYVFGCIVPPHWWSVQDWLHWISPENPHSPSSVCWRTVVYCSWASKGSPPLCQLHNPESPTGPLPMPNLPIITLQQIPPHAHHHYLGHHRHHVYHYRHHHSGVRYPIWFNSMFEFCQKMIHSIFNSILLYPRFNSKYYSIQNELWWFNSIVREWLILVE